jgi:hypothetical protein
MATLEPLDLSQPKNKLSSYAEAERAKLLPKNDYNKTNEYSSVNPDALATNDEQGKGTGGDLDTNNFTAGNITDNLERKNELKINSFSVQKPYTTPSA